MYTVTVYLGRNPARGGRRPRGPALGRAKGQMTRPPRLVLDTNVLVSAFLWEGNPGRILAKAESGEVRLYTSWRVKSDSIHLFRAARVNEGVV